MSDEKQLRQAKKRDKKVYITDIAIEKVPYVKYKGMDEEQNEIMQKLARLVLKISKTQNDSNEVAIMWDMASRSMEGYGIDRGDEHSVCLGGDPVSYHLLHSGEKVVLVLLHNHPSTRTFSLEDIYLLLERDNVKYMVMVSNQGQIHYIKKEEDFNTQNAGMMYNKIRSEGKRQGISAYQMSLTFLKRCNEVGLFYR